ncbi:MAG: DNA polymerase III subunit delta [Micrococcales bacterium]|nr:DNA polymerase III subunit delta [Micrococcales bacterium]
MPTKQSRALPWNRAEPASLVLVTGPEDLLAERAIARLIRLDQQVNPESEVVRIDAAQSDGPGVRAAAGGSLFTSHTIVVASQVDQLSEGFMQDSLAYLSDPNPDAMVIWRHRAGVRGKKLLDALKTAGASQVQCPEIKWDSDKASFAIEEFRAAERLADRTAIEALVDAVGTDLRELAAACQQLANDTTGRISKPMVDRYYGGRVEATGFAVADAAVAGDVAKAVALARHAMACGVDPLPLVAALAMKLRTLARVAGAKRAGLDPVKDLKVNAWQAGKARKELVNWDGPRLGTAIRAVARADAEVKGLGGAGGKIGRAYAAERAILAVAQQASAS